MTAASLRATTEVWRPRRTLHSSRSRPSRATPRKAFFVGFSRRERARVRSGGGSVYQRRSVKSHRQRGVTEASESPTLAGPGSNPGAVASTAGPAEIFDNRRTRRMWGNGCLRAFQALRCGFESRHSLQWPVRPKAGRRSYKPLMGVRVPHRLPISLVSEGKRRAARL